MSGHDGSADIDIPSQCPECGSSSVIYDRDKNEIICSNPKCAIVLDLEALKDSAAWLLRSGEVTPRKLILEWCHRRRLYEADKAQLEAKHVPDLRRLEHQITQVSGLACKICGVEISRKGEEKNRGRLPDYCRACARKKHLDSVKKYRTNHPERVRQTKRNYREKIKKTGGQGSKESRLGGKPFRLRDLRRLRTLGHYDNSVYSSREIPAG